jgi:hypothetical protein
VLMHSSNHYPLGNCDSPGSETNPGYLTQSGAVSNRSSLPSSFFAFTDGARTPPEELVNPASSIACISTDFTGVVSTSLTRPFPGCPGVSLKLLRQIFTHSPAVSFLTSPALERFSRDLPSRRVLPGACAPFVHLSVVFFGRFQTVD